MRAARFARHRISRKSSHSVTPREPTDGLCSIQFKKESVFRCRFFLYMTFHFAYIVLYCIQFILKNWGRIIGQI